MCGAWAGGAASPRLRRRLLRGSVQGVVGRQVLPLCSQQAAGLPECQHHGLLRLYDAWGVAGKGDGKNKLVFIEHGVFFRSAAFRASRGFSCLKQENSVGAQFVLVAFQCLHEVVMLDAQQAGDDTAVYAVAFEDDSHAVVGAG